MSTDRETADGARPLKLTVVIEDRHKTHISVVHEQPVVPYGRRSVQIMLA